MSHARYVELALHPRVVAVVVVDRTDVRQDLPAPRIDRHERRVPDVAVVQLLDPLADLAFADLLLGQIERGRDAVAAASDGCLVATEDLRKLGADLEDEMRGLDLPDL